MTVTASLRSSLSSKARARPVVSANASSGARYGSNRFQSASNDKRRQTASNYRTNGPCGPMVTPMGPFFGMDMMDALLDPCGPRQQQSTKGRSRSPSWGNRRILVDIAETDSAYEIAAELPGLSKDSIKVDVDGDELTLSVQKPADPTSADSPPADSPSVVSSASTATASAADTDAPEQQQQQQRQGKSGRRVRRRERGTAFTDRTLRMPEAADMEAVSAEYEAGVLTVTVQKKAEAVAQRRQVPVA